MPTRNQIDALLPQTQCGLCGHKGCMPYATALAEDNAPINLCPPGGVAGLFALAKALEQDPAPYIEELTHKSKPPVVAFIREEDCIGCTKCIQACPVDAILGSAKNMHSVISQECTGCELCIAPCPVDCIELLETQLPRTPSLYKKRYLAREERLKQEGLEQEVVQKEKIQSAKKLYIEAALLRIKNKKKTTLPL